MKVFYDVCNDYSLAQRDDVPNDLSKYRKVECPMGTLYVHKEYDELHYLEGVAGLNGQECLYYCSEG